MNNKNVKTTICLHCGEEVNYYIKEEPSIIEFREVSVEYLETSAYCAVCGEKVDADELWNINLKKIHLAYCNQINRISSEQIKEILTMYRIGKGPLAKIFGLGEITIKRYCNGFIPTKIISDELLEVYKSPEYFLLKLEKAKRQISQCAYKKALEAANQVLKNLNNTSIVFTCIDVFTFDTKGNSEKAFQNKYNIALAA